jgi:hypothetical protein
MKSDCRWGYKAEAEEEGMDDGVVARAWDA